MFSWSFISSTIGLEVWKLPRNIYPTCSCIPLFYFLCLVLMRLFLLVTAGMIKVTPLTLPTTTLLAHWLTHQLVRSLPMAFQVMRTLSQLARSILLTHWPPWRLVSTTMAEQVLWYSMNGAQNLSSPSLERLTPEQLKRVLKLGWPWHSSHRGSNYRVNEGGSWFWSEIWREIMYPSQIWCHGL